MIDNGEHDSTLRGFCLVQASVADKYNCPPVNDSGWGGEVSVCQWALSCVLLCLKEACHGR